MQGCHPSVLFPHPSLPLNPCSFSIHTSISVKFDRAAESVTKTVSSSKESMVCERATRKISYGSSARTHSRWAAIGPAQACAAWSRPSALPFPQLVARRPGCNPGGLQGGWGNCSSCWERRGGREYQMKTALVGKWRDSSNDSLQICRQSDFAIFACWMCLLKPFLDCARYSVAVWVKMCGLQIDSCTLSEVLFW